MSRAVNRIDTNIPLHWKGVNHTREFSSGYAPVLDCHTAHIACKFAELLEQINCRTSKKLEVSLKVVKSGNAAMIKLKNESSKQGKSFFQWSMLHCLLVSAHCYLGVGDCCECFFFSNIATPHTLPARLLSFGEDWSPYEKKSWKRAQTTLNLDMLPWSNWKVSSQSKDSVCFIGACYVLFNIFAYFFSQIFQNFSR